MNQKTAIIIGAGPAGLTAAYEILQKIDIKPVVLEATNDIGGISKTVNYKGNRIDIGGHRFFSKSDRVMDWWQTIMPVQGFPVKNEKQIKQNNQFIHPQNSGPDPEKNDKVFLVRNRLSRIYFLRKFFNYPISLSFETLAGLGFFQTIKIGLSYLYSRIFPIRREKSLEDFFINRFGRELYQIFFKDYTEKVWGIACNQIEPEWGAQRIKELSVTKAIIHAMRSVFSKDNSLSQKETQTSLIERFLYPKYGPGQIWEEVAKIIEKDGGQLHMRHRVVKINKLNHRIVSVLAKNENTKELIEFKGHFFFSTMPVKDLIVAFDRHAPAKVKEIAKGLVYRDFITVGLLLKSLKIKSTTNHKTTNNIVPDNWIYIQERDVKLGRLQIFNNWSPYMVRDADKVWIGLEYFCDEGDKLWQKSDDEFASFAIDELSRIEIINKDDVLDHVAIRIPKAYPAYFGAYSNFSEIKSFTDTFANLFLIGRNGMHKYNNQDHSMLTAMVAVENIINGIETKDNIWEVNEENEYHENK